MAMTLPSHVISLRKRPERKGAENLGQRSAAGGWALVLCPHRAAATMKGRGPPRSAVPTIVNGAGHATGEEALGVKGVGMVNGVR